ncbi:hypothetical protein KI387_017789, partial [Taxus chinensis]
VVKGQEILAEWQLTGVLGNTGINRWSLKATRLRRLQLTLDYLQSDDIELALEALVSVNAAEEGVLRVLFTAVEQVLSKIGGDNEIAQASRLLALAARFATKMVCCYGRLKWKRHNHQFEIHSMEVANFMDSSSLLNSSLNEADISGKLCEMAHLLEVIRNLQDRVNGKRKRPIQGMKEAGDEMSSMVSRLQNSDMPPSSCEDNLVGGISTKAVDQLALSPLDTFIATGSSKELSISTLSIDGRDTQILPRENPKDMVRRWEVEQLDLTTVVKDALRSGRLPLAVLQLHRLHSKESSKLKEPYDVFKEVQELGKTIVYNFFCEGKTALAIAALHRLGEDVEVNLRELAFGTVRRTLRFEVTQELKRHSYLRSRDVNILERISLVERLYPSGSFWSTYAARQRPLLVNSVLETLAEEAKLQLICTWGPFTDYTIECGEIDGVVIGSWSSISTEEGFISAQTEDNASAGYWAGAAVWLDAWDQRMVDRVILDQPFFMGVHISWEAQFEYFIAHNDWEEVSKLVDIIPPSVLKEGTLHIQLDFKDTFITPSFKKLDGTEYFSLGHSVQELDAVEMVLPKIKLLRFSLGHGCAISMRKLIEEKLAENFIFLQDYWKGTQEIISLLARAGLIFNVSHKPPSTEVDDKFSDLEFSDMQYGNLHKDTVQAFHILVLHHCIKHDLPHLLDIYLDGHSLGLDNASVSLMRAVAKTREDLFQQRKGIWIEGVKREKRVEEIAQKRVEEIAQKRVKKEKKSDTESQIAAMERMLEEMTSKLDALENIQGCCDSALTQASKAKRPAKVMEKERGQAVEKTVNKRKKCGSVQHVRIYEKQSEEVEEEDNIAVVVEELAGKDTTVKDDCLQVNMKAREWESDGMRLFPSGHTSKNSFVAVRGVREDSQKRN